MNKLLFSCGVVVCLCSMALAQNAGPRGLGGASWVWDQPDGNQVGQNNEPRYLRRTFQLASEPRKGKLWISADNHYIVYINGHKVGEDREWSTVEEYDVTKHLVRGKNVLAIQARNEGGPAGVIARL